MVIYVLTFNDANFLTLRSSELMNEEQSKCYEMVKIMWHIIRTSEEILNIVHAKE